jgi:hypothetical protein
MLLALIVAFNQLALSNPDSDTVRLETILGAPDALQVGIMKPIHSEYFTMDSYANMSYLPISFQSGRRSITLLQTQAGIRVFPWKFKLYTAFNFGFRHLNFEASTESFSIEEMAITHGKIVLDQLYIGLHIGYEFAINRSVSIGLEAGVQIPVYGSNELELLNKARKQSSKNNATLKTNTYKQMNRIAYIVIPSIQLIRITILL